MRSVPRSTPAYHAWLLPAGTLFFMCGILIGRVIDLLLPVLLAIGLTVCAAILSRRWRRTLALLLTALSLGTALSYAAYHPSLPPEGECIVRGTVMAEVVQEDAHVQTLLTNVTLDGVSADDAYWTFYLQKGEALPDWLVPGVRVEMTAEVYHPDGKSNPSGFDFREYLLQRGIRIGVYGADGLAESTPVFSLSGTMAALRHTLSQRLTQVMGADGGAYAAAMLLGTKDFIAEDDLSAFRSLGIMHILSVSGYHVGVMSVWLLFLLRLLPIGGKGRLACETVLLGLYCLLTGGNAPVVRAVMLFLLRDLTRVSHRQRLPLHLLCTAALIQLAINPTLLTSASFQLTYSAMLGLMLVCPWVTSRVHCRTRLGKRLWKAFAVSLSAQLGLLLPQLYWFGSLPVLSILINMLIIPLSTLLMSLYWLTLAVLPLPGVRTALGALSGLATRGFLALVRALAALPLFSIRTQQADLLTLAGCTLLLFSLSVLVPRGLRRYRRWGVLLGALLTALILLPLPQTACTYTQLNVGNADAAILRDGAVTVVIDLGEDGQEVVSSLNEAGEAIDVLILTHLHADHAGGLQAALDADIPVGVCCLPVGATRAETDSDLLPLLDALSAAGTEVCELQRGDSIVLPRCTLNVLWPQDDRMPDGQDANDVCLVMLADIRGVSMLLTGDITGKFEAYVAVPADLLKVAHHGSTASTSADFLSAVDPQLLVLSNKMDSRQTRMEALAGDIPLYATSECGAVTFVFPGDGLFRIESALPIGE